MVIVILIVLGICLGSFVNAFVWRFHEGKAATIATGRSMCSSCKHELAAKDLIPVVSYLWLRGKCRYCHKTIEDTPLSELLTPLVFVLSYIFWPYALSGGGLFLFCSWLVFLIGFMMLTLYDLRWFELPHRIVLPLIGLALLQTVIFARLYHAGLSNLLHALWGGLIGGGVFYGLYKFSPKEVAEDGQAYSKWIGGGDITLGLLLGILVGGPANALLLIFAASLLGTLVALPLLITGKASRTSHLPFGPYLMAAAVIVMLWGGPLVSWYTSQFVR